MNGGANDEKSPEKKKVTETATNSPGREKEPLLSNERSTPIITDPHVSVNRY